MRKHASATGIAGDAQISMRDGKQNQDEHKQERSTTADP
jgi:hypothetical protein